MCGIAGIVCLRDGVEPPSGTATVVGWLRVTERPGSLQRDDADLGNHQFARIDIAGIERSTGRAYAPVYVQADRITPVSHAERLAAHLGAPLELFPGGHLLQVGHRQREREPQPRATLRGLEQLQAAFAKYQDVRRVEVLRLQSAARNSLRSPSP